MVAAPDEALEPALERLALSNRNRTLVLGPGSAVGLLSITDATRIIEARRAAIGAGRPVAAARPADADQTMIVPGSTAAPALRR